jgi:hypothetical protein
MTAATAPQPAESPEAAISASTDVSLAFPPEAMYGRLGELARQTEMPLGLSYPALLGCFSYVPMPDEMCRTRINLYVGLIAPVGGGKNTAITRACRLLDLKKKLDWRVTTASSDRGLMGIIGDRTEGKGSNKRTVPGPTKMLLRTNEMRGTLKKAAIEGSVLADMLCEVWDSGQWECSDKTGSQACDCRLSWIGGIPVKDDSPEEFAEAFGRETSNGLMSRMLLGYGAGEKFDGSKPWDPEVIVGIRETSYDPGLMDDAINSMLAASTYQTVGSIAPEAMALYTAWVNPIDADGRLKYNLMKVAVLTASANLESEVSVQCMQAAIVFIEWQCTLRQVYKPSEAKDTPEAVLGEIIMDKFHKMAALGQEPIRWRRVAHDMKWRKHGPSLVNRTVEGLVAMGELEYGRADKDSKKVIMDRNSTEGKRCPLIVWVKWAK